MHTDLPYWLLFTTFEQHSYLLVSNFYTCWIHLIWKIWWNRKRGKDKMRRKNANFSLSLWKMYIAVCQFPVSTYPWLPNPSFKCVLIYLISFCLYWKQKPNNYLRLNGHLIKLWCMPHIYLYYSFVNFCPLPDICWASRRDQTAWTFPALKIKVDDRWCIDGKSNAPCYEDTLRRDLKYTRCLIQLLMILRRKCCSYYLLKGVVFMFLFGSFHGHTNK